MVEPTPLPTHAIHPTVHTIAHTLSILLQSFIPLFTPDHHVHTPLPAPLPTHSLLPVHPCPPHCPHSSTHSPNHRSHCLPPPVPPQHPPRSRAGPSVHTRCPAIPLEQEGDSQSISCAGDAPSGMGQQQECAGRDPAAHPHCLEPTGPWAQPVRFPAAPRAVRFTWPTWALPGREIRGCPGNWAGESSPRLGCTPSPQPRATPRESRRLCGPLPLCSQPWR